MLGARHDAQADADLAVGHLPGGTGVLPLHPDRVLALLEKSGGANDPRRHRLANAHRGDRVPGGLGPHRTVRPWALCEKVQKPVVRTLRSFRIAARSRGDGLDAFPLAVAQDSERIRRERFALLTPALSIS